MVCSVPSGKLIPVYATQTPTTTPINPHIAQPSPALHRCDLCGRCGESGWVRICRLRIDIRTYDRSDNFKHIWWYRYRYCAPPASRVLILPLLTCKQLRGQPLTPYRSFSLPRVPAITLIAPSRRHGHKY